MEILEAINLSKYYTSGEKKIKAVDNVNLTVKKGDFIAIIGPSGSGKSTLMHLLSGLDKPDSGQVFINKENIYKLKEKELTKFRCHNIGFIYQFYNLLPVLTIRENIVLPAILDKGKVDFDYLEELIQILDLKERLNYLPHQLSGGQQQRTSIGRALINKPQILFADEPTGNLDNKSKRQVINLFKYYNKEYNQTIIMVTHDKSLAKMAKKILIFKDGKIKSALY